MGNKHKEQCIKNKRISLFIFTLLLLFNAKFVLMSTKAGQIMKSYKIM